MKAQKMYRTRVLIIPVMIFLIFPIVTSVEDEVRRALVQFMNKLSPENVKRGNNWGWNLTSDPCTDLWEGVTCDSQSTSVRKITLDNYNLSGVLDAGYLCKADSLEALSLENNKINGLISEEIRNCQQLKYLYLSANNFSGDLPDSVSQLANLKSLEIADNSLYGELPDLQKISGLKSFHGQNNQLSGRIPNFDFSNIEEFNVSNNNLSGRIPDVKDRFLASSFEGNPGLCGKPLLNVCPLSMSDEEESKKSSSDGFYIYSGYIIIGLLFFLILALKFLCKTKPEKEEKADVMVTKDVEVNPTSKKFTNMSCELRTENRSQYSLTSIESRKAPPLVVLSNLKVKGLTFEELLRAPAELLGRGKHGSTFKVMLNNGMTVAVKRIKDWRISSEEFQKRMNKINKVKHSNILPPVAFYCCKQEKLLVYEYQQSGSLFQLLHESENGQILGWGSRLSVAAYIAEALALMHKELQGDGIAHGNLKSTNILFNNNMYPCISEYGLLVPEIEDQTTFLSPTNSFTFDDPQAAGGGDIFKSDVYCFGVILLELLTGKVVRKKGFDLAKWVQLAVREEWTAEVFDESLLTEGANEESMVNFLQVALKCINPCLNERPSISQVAVTLNLIREEGEKSVSFYPSSCSISFIGQPYRR